MSTAKATTDAAAISKQLDYLARALKGTQDPGSSRTSG